MRVETVHPRHKGLENRVMIDTSVWLGAALSAAGAPSQVVRRVLSAGVPVFSDATVAELEARIWKPEFDRHLSMPARTGILHDVCAVGPWVHIPEDIAEQRFSRDGDDDKFIHTGLAASAHWSTTGDQDSLVIQADLGV